MTPMQLIFMLAAVITLGSALMVVSARNILHAALWLVASLFGVAMLFALLQANFFAVVQVVVYIGAIAILVIFAVMLTRRVMQDSGSQVIRAWWLAAILAAMVFGGLVYMLSSWRGFWNFPPTLVNADAPLVQLGLSLVSPNAYVVPFEVASVLLLAALIGAIYVAFQRK
jgi:NADH:ubiquinone oxidoreductase subunit 6 (subunit J)